MDYLELALRMMHILGAVLLLGSIFFQRFVLFPALGDLSEGETAEKLRQLLRGRVARLTMLSAALLLISGLVNTARVSIAYRFPDGDYNLLLAVKLVLALGIFYLASALAGRSASAEKLRANPLKWLNVLLVAAILMIGLGAAMKLAKRVDKPRVDAPAAHRAPAVHERRVSRSDHARPRLASIPSIERTVRHSGSVSGPVTISSCLARTVSIDDRFDARREG